MSSLSEHENVLMLRLGKRGMGKSIIPGFTWSIKNCLLDNPEMDHSKVNERLHFLGCDDIDLDYHTLQLVVACFEAGGFKKLKSN